MQREQLLSIDSPIKDIADDIAEKYLLRSFPTNKLANGLLDYSELRKSRIDPNKLERSIHGFVNACHVAALVPVIIQFYREHRADLIDAVNKELDEINALDIKKIQIVGMMRATGRPRDNESGKVFCEQGAAECSAYLKNLGLGPDESNQLAQSIIELEGKPRCLASLVLMDATLMETFRDGVA